LEHPPSERKANPDAQRLFDDYLAALEGGADISAGSLLGKHPDHEEDLRRLIKEWQDFQSFAAALVGDFGIEDPEASVGARHIERLHQERDKPRHFELRGELGRGGMGVVLRVYDDQIRRELAMKVLRAHESKTGGPPTARAVERFLAEAQITGQLDHPGVVPIHEIGVDGDDHPYFTMALVRGRDLRVILKLAKASEEGWSAARVVGVLLKVCETLAYAHSKKVVHRDVKPANVMVGRLGEVYMMDWGLAKSGWQDEGVVFDDNTAESVEVRTLRNPDSTESSDALDTLDGAVLGTPSFMSPEQASGRVRGVGPRSDVYAVGAMLYQLLSGLPPYVKEASSATNEVLHLLRAGPPVAIRELATAAPPELIAICEKAMAREPQNRYPTMEAMADDLRAHYEGRVVRSYETGAIAEFRKWFQRNRTVGVALSAAVILVLFSLCCVLYVQIRANRKLDTANIAVRQEAEILASVLEWTEDMFESAGPIRARQRHVSAKELIDRAAANFAREVNRDSKVRARLAGAIGGFYTDLGLDAEAESLLATASEASLQAFGPHDPRTIKVRALYATSLGGLDRVQEAETEFARLAADLGYLDVESRVLVLNTRGGFNYRRKALGLAEEDWRQALELTSELPLDHDLALTLRNNLGVLLHHRGDYEEAERLLQEVWRMRVDLFGEDHPDTIYVLANLAEVAREQARYEDAREGMEQALRLSRSVLGEDHPLTLERMLDLALVLEFVGELAQALEVVEEAHGHATRELERKDPLLIEVRARLANLLGVHGRYGEARPILVEDLQILRETLPPGDLRLAIALTELGNTELMLNNRDPARELLDEALKLRRQAPDGGVLHMINVLSYLGRIYLLDAQDDGSNAAALGKAEMLLQEAYDLSRRDVGDASPFTVRATFRLGEVYQVQGDEEQAIERFEEAVGLAREYLPPTSPIRWQALYRFAKFLHASEYYGEAHALTQELLQHVSPEYQDYSRFLRFDMELEELLESH
jgi:serine/threonine protein kinase/tetratricopeptide (TPR) repeat protein